MSQYNITSDPDSSRDEKGKVIFSSSAVIVNAYPTFASLLLVYFYFSRFFLEKWFMPKVHGANYLELDTVKRRSFACHHQWLIVKLCLIPSAIPFIRSFFMHQSMQAPVFPGSGVTNGDWLAVCFMAVIAMFIFEITYRTSISPVSLIHHTAGIILSVWQIAVDINDDSASNDSQFRLLILYGVFEVVFETIPHAAVIYYRMYPKNYAGCARIWFVSGCFSLVGTSGEVIAVAIFMWRFWKLWNLELKVIQPILHFAFMAAQVHGARVAFQLAVHYRKKHLKALKEAEQARLALGSPSDEMEEGKEVTISMEDRETLVDDDKLEKMGTNFPTQG